MFRKSHLKDILRVDTVDIGREGSPLSDFGFPIEDFIGIPDTIALDDFKLQQCELGPKVESFKNIVEDKTIEYKFQARKSANWPARQVTDTETDSSEILDKIEGDQFGGPQESERRVAKK